MRGHTNFIGVALLFIHLLWFYFISRSSCKFETVYVRPLFDPGPGVVAPGTPPLDGPGAVGKGRYQCQFDVDSFCVVE